MKLQKIKFFSLITILSAVSFFCFGEQYRINSLTFYSSGITQSAALQRTVSVDKKHVFNSTEELQKYIADVTQEVINIRQLDNVIPNLKLNLKLTTNLSWNPFPGKRAPCRFCRRHNDTTIASEEKCQTLIYLHIITFCKIHYVFNYQLFDTFPLR